MAEYIPDAIENPAGILDVDGQPLADDAVYLVRMFAAHPRYVRVSYDADSDTFFCVGCTARGARFESARIQRVDEMSTHLTWQRHTDLI